MTPIVYIGWDPREDMACNVAAASLHLLTPQARVLPLMLGLLREQGLYYRPTTVLNGGLYDIVSAAPMSTEHAIARFLVPSLQRRQGWALFVDGDVLFRRSIDELWALRDETKALMVVQHPPVEQDGTKKEGQPNLAYARKNWSSVMLFNCGHAAHKQLSVDVINTVPGRDLHRFCWLQDDQIGALPPEWNYLVGVNPRMEDPAIVHFTLGVPALPKYATAQFSYEWFEMARRAGHGR